MRWPSISLILSEVFLAYIAYAIYVLSQLFVAPTCEEGKFCLTSYLSTKPRLQLHMFSSINRNPMEREVTIVNMISNFDYNAIQDIPVKLNIPRKTQQNGTMFLHMLLVPESKKHGRPFNDLKRDPYMAYTVTKMTQYAVPEAETFNLLGKKDAAKDGTRKSKEQTVHPVTHIKSRVTFTVMTDDIKLPIDNIPMELINNIRVVQSSVFLPIVNFDFLQTRQRDLVRVSPQNNTMNVTVSYNPITLGKLRLMLHIEATMHSLENLGFSNKNTDELKAIFADTNIYLLAATFIIAALHLLFDFLTFKNDVSFWRRKDNLIGLSKWTVIWRAFSQTVIFFYLLDENSSMLVLVPTGVGTFIEFWKIKKVLRAEFVRGPGILPRIRFNTSKSTAAEIKTREFDAESMRYLSYLLYPLVIGGAIYSLLYQPYKSWYSWIINSLVKGVYAFGFLFMLPQLFVNYKLKSVAHLPWRAFMYKAFNTFIDDVFAFIITMPTAHRIACFRDDVVFLIYLYQRWLYPVDNTRIDADAITEEAVNLSASNKKRN